MHSQHSASLVSTIQPSDKLVHVDYSSDASLYYASLSQPASASDNSQLLARLRDDIRAQLETSCAAHNRLQRSNEFNGESSSSPAAGARAVVVVLDSLNVLLEQSPVQKVLRFLRELRQNPHVGSVIVRFNASTQPTATRQLLTSESTAVAVVETPASLSAYPILAKERRREVPKDMHGFVLLLRQKKVRHWNQTIHLATEVSNVCLFACVDLEWPQQRERGLLPDRRGPHAVLHGGPGREEETGERRESRLEGLQRVIPGQRAPVFFQLERHTIQCFEPNPK